MLYHQPEQHSIVMYIVIVGLTDEVIDFAVVLNSCKHTILAAVRSQESSSLHTNPASPSGVVSCTNPSYFVVPSTRVAALFCSAEISLYKN